MFGASSEHVREHVRIGALRTSELASNIFGASSELDSVMEFGYYQQIHTHAHSLQKCMNSVHLVSEST